ncbi:MAG: hypothetical protein IK990_19790 [Ruminiclostridium sp.]|nr:hypothetical protein [Ruminiclostridium sp.]
MVYFGYFFEYRKGKAHIGISNDTKVREFKDYKISDIVRQIYELSANHEALKTGVENLCNALTSSKGERKAAMEPLEALSMNDNICLQYIIDRLFDDFGNAETDFGSGKQSLTTLINGLTLPMNIEKKRKKWQSELMNTFTKLTAPFVSIAGTLANPDCTATAVICGDKQYTVCESLGFFICDLHRGCEKHDIKITRCEICGKMFAPANGRVKYCSKECGDKARNENIKKIRDNTATDPIKHEVERSISYMKNYVKKVKDEFGADSRQYIEFHDEFVEYKDDIRNKRDRLIRDVEWDKIDVPDAVEVMSEFDKEREKKLAKKASVLLVAAKA